MSAVILFAAILADIAVCCVVVWLWLRVNYPQKRIVKKGEK